MRRGTIWVASAVLLLSLCHTPYAASPFKTLMNLVLGTKTTRTPPLPQARIIGGSPVGVTERCTSPFTAVAHIQLRQVTTSGTVQYTTLCSGSLLSSNIVVTAGRCLQSLGNHASIDALDMERVNRVSDPSLYQQKLRSESLLAESRILPNRELYSDFMSSSVLNLYVTLGDTDAGLLDTGEARIRAESIKFHAGFDISSSSDNKDNNIALIKLSVDAVLGTCIQPIARYDSSTDSSCSGFSQDCIIAGWGATESAIPGQFFPSQSLQKGTVNVITDTSLANKYTQQVFPGEASPLKEGITYVVRKTGNVGTCRYDYGSMLACMVNGQYMLWGVLATHNLCASNPFQSVDRPMYITGMEYYKAWLDSCLADYSTCNGQLVG